MIESYKVLELLSKKSPARNSKCQRKTRFKLILYVNVCFVRLLINVLVTHSLSLETEKSLFASVLSKASFSLFFSFHITSFSLPFSLSLATFHERPTSITGCPLRRGLNKVTFNVSVLYVRVPFV